MEMEDLRTALAAFPIGITEGLPDHRIGEYAELYDA